MCGIIRLEEPTGASKMSNQRPRRADARYMQIILDCVRVCLGYKPKFGRGRAGGLALSAFQELYGNDPLYSWFGLDNPLMYAAHKAAGGITSIYRQIGIGCERVFRQALQDTYGLSQQDVTWSYEIDMPNGKKRTLHLDGRVQLDSIRNNASRKRFHDWMKQSAELVGIDQGVFDSLTGAVLKFVRATKAKTASGRTLTLPTPPPLTPSPTCHAPQFCPLK